MPPHPHRPVTSQPPRPLVLAAARPRTPARSPSPCLAPSALARLIPRPPSPPPRMHYIAPVKISSPRPLTPTRLALLTRCPHPTAWAPQLLAHRPRSPSHSGPRPLRHDSPSSCPIAPSLPRTPAVSPSWSLDPSPHAPLVLRRPLSSSLTRPDRTLPRRCPRSLILLCCRLKLLRGPGGGSTSKTIARISSTANHHALR